MSSVLRASCTLCLGLDPTGNPFPNVQTQGSKEFCTTKFELRGGGCTETCSDLLFGAEGVGYGSRVRPRPRKQGINKEVLELWPGISVGEDWPAAMVVCTKGIVDRPALTSPHHT